MFAADIMMVDTVPVLPMMEDEELSHGSPESSLWNAVLLQLLKEAEYLRRSLKRTDRVIKDTARKSSHREKAFAEHYDSQHGRKSMSSYILTNDFQTICDFAGHEHECVRAKIIDILDGRDSVTDNQVKRSFTRKS